jgi:hypothetical protein
MEIVKKAYSTEEILGMVKSRLLDLYEEQNIKIYFIVGIMSNIMAFIMCYWNYVGYINTLFLRITCILSSILILLVSYFLLSFIFNRKYTCFDLIEEFKAVEKIAAEENPEREFIAKTDVSRICCVGMYMTRRRGVKTLPLNKALLMIDVLEKNEIAARDEVEDARKNAERMKEKNSSENT